ncbi:MAG: beta-ketoacyl synthase chain length factor [Flavobacteriales bacterium]|nr:beta-ketoacyl synthase chain length factor [Flavobacteriales bacterium]
MRSTHNTVPGLLALALKAQGPNLTFSQGFIGFHAALLNAMMHVEEHPAHRVLVGASDEHLPLLDHLYAQLGGEARFGNTVRPAEGTAFFVVSGEKAESTCRIADVRIASVDLLDTTTLYATERSKLAQQWIRPERRDHPTRSEQACTRAHRPWLWRRGWSGSTPRRTSHRW